MNIQVSASILSADFANLESEIKRLNNSYVDAIHIDIMDGVFVDNITIGYEVVKSIKKYSTLEFDVHLMINKPEKFIKKFAENGADIITIHPETTNHLDGTIKIIKSLGIKAGIALLPTTNESVLEYIIDDIDLVLIMSVNPGFGGQKFITSQLKKISNVRKMIEKTGKNIILSVDGGINAETAKICVDAGANRLVSGSYLFSGDIEKNVLELKAL
jgi:ribulose-phosphate 3-epimerase